MKQMLALEVKKALVKLQDICDLQQAVLVSKMQKCTVKNQSFIKVKIEKVKWLLMKRKQKDMQLMFFHISHLINGNYEMELSIMKDLE